jgi:D-alanyl-D-alanine carboxypeptidase (penicillin-binding protein 5/6)
MSNLSRVHGSELKDGRSYPLIFFLSLLFIFQCSLTTSFADTIRSRAAVVMDASTGRILYAKNPDLRCPPASTTKLMTAIIAVEHADMKDLVTISRNASRISPHKAGFRAGEKVTVEELLHAALIGSANDAAVALAEAVGGSEDRFVEIMNWKTMQIGAANTRFINASGLPGPGQYITASDLSKIMSYALKSPILKQIIGTRSAEISTERGRTIHLRNTNRLLWSEEDLVGGKTGYTRKARHCFVCAAERDEDTVIVALLGSPSRKGLWRESETLIGRGFSVMENGEEPSNYLVKAEDLSVVKKSAYKKKSKLRKAVKSKRGKKFIVKKKAKQKKKRLLSKKKSRSKALAKKYKKRNYSVAKEDAIDRNKG